MDQKIFHGKITPDDVAQNLMAHFHRGNLIVQQVGAGEKIVVQISTSPRPSAGGQTALSVFIQEIEDGIAVSVGQQQWLGVAASLGITAFSILRNPFTVLHRLDDLAQDIEYLQLSDEIWRIINQTAQSLDSNFQISERLRRLECKYCGTANPVGEPQCIACGAPLGEFQPKTCPYCGNVISRSEKVCPNCKRES